MSGATPNFPNVVGTSVGAFVKPASVDLILDSDNIPIELISNLIFEEIGGQELINIARNDIINGQDVIYNPISNINKIALQYNSKNLVPVAGSLDQTFKNFQISLASKIEEGVPVYLDETTGDLVIELSNLAEDEDVEVQIISSGGLFDDTIY